MKTTNIHTHNGYSVRELWSRCDRFADELDFFLDCSEEHENIDKATLGDVADLIMILNVIEDKTATLREDIYAHLGLAVDD